MDNILLTRAYDIKLCDFGFACVDGYYDSKLGTSGYMAPEIGKGPYNAQKVDIYALGITILRILTGKNLPVFKPNLILRFLKLNTESEKN